MCRPTAAILPLPRLALRRRPLAKTTFRSKQLSR